MNIAGLAEEIFDALQEFDRLIAPFGLYAAGDLAGEEPEKKIQRGRSWEGWKNWKTARDHPEWEGALKAVFENRSGNLSAQFLNSGCAFQLSDVGRVQLIVSRTSKIKVRQYGSKYHVDKHENFVQRWDELRMDKAIADLWASNESNIKLRLLLFLGFDKAQRPFERELGELKPHQTRASHNIEFYERTWDDSIGRGFKIKAALWAHQSTSS